MLGHLFCPRDQQRTSRRGSGPPGGQLARPRKKRGSSLSQPASQPATGGPTDQPNQLAKRASSCKEARPTCSLRPPFRQTCAATCCKASCPRNIGGPVALQQRTTPIAYMQPWAHHMDTHTPSSRGEELPSPIPPRHPQPTIPSRWPSVGNEAWHCRQLLARERERQASQFDYFFSPLSRSPRLVSPVRCDLAPVSPVHTETWLSLGRANTTRDGKSKRVVSKRRGSCSETCIQHYAPR